MVSWEKIILLQELLLEKIQYKLTKGWSRKWQSILEIAQLLILLRPRPLSKTTDTINRQLFTTYSRSRQIEIHLSYRLQLNLKKRGGRIVH